MSAQSFDLIVLGAGSGGIATAIRAARHGARVALLEPGVLGGTCVNVGCVPKKAMWIAANIADTLRMARGIGFAGSIDTLDWPLFVGLRDAYIDNIHASYRKRFAETGVALIEAHGRLVAADRVVVGDEELTAAQIVIATGGHPQRPDIDGADLGIDSNGFFDLRACPRRVAIIGGGYIAVELAGVLNSLGAEVSLVARKSRLLQSFDHEMATALGEIMRTHGIVTLLNARLKAVERDGDSYALRLSSDDDAARYDEIIWATGRTPNTAGFGLDAVGVALDDDGYIIADDQQRTNIEGIHAVGDVTGQLALTPVAVAAGRHLADRLFGGKSDARMDYDNVPTVVFAHPPLASVGCSEQAARDKHGADVRIYRARFRPMRTALGGHGEKTLMKLVCVGTDERVVGIHMLGHGADEMLQGFAVALKMGACKADFDATVAIHPTSAEEMVLLSDPGEAFVGAAD